MHCVSEFGINLLKTHAIFAGFGEACWWCTHHHQPAL